MGDIVLLPTETIYGLACRYGKAYEEKLQKLKKRDPHKKFSMVVSGKDHLENFLKPLPPVVEGLVDQFWPGPLTIILTCNQSQWDQQMIGFRCPNHVVWDHLLPKLDFPICLTSANLSGGEDPTLFDSIHPFIKKQCSYYYKDDDAVSGISSTIVSYLNKELKIIRDGSLKIGDIHG